MIEIAQQLVTDGLDRDAIVQRLHELFPNESIDSCGYAATGAWLGRNIPSPPPQQPPQAVPVSQRPYAPLPPEPQPKIELPTRDKYNWSRIGGVTLPVEAQADRTYLPATIASMPSIFNGVPNSTHHFEWGTVTVRGVLMPSDLKPFTAFLQEVQDNNGTVAGGCLAAETSFKKLYARVTGGKYGGSGCARFQRSMKRLKSTYIEVRRKDGTVYTFRLIESYEFVKARSGKRLIVRLGSVLTQHMCLREGDKPTGCKPLELEPWRDLRGRTAIAYLLFDNLSALHNFGLIGLDLLTKRLDLKGSEPRRKHKLAKLIERLDGLALSSGGVLRLRIIRDNIRYERVVPAPAAAA